MSDILKRLMMPLPLVGLVITAHLYALPLQKLGSPWLDISDRR